MADTLIIVESPTKARTLTRFLGRGYTIEASMGHIRDLPKRQFGVDVDNHFEPKYVIPKDKKAHVDYLKKIAKKAKSIILATDPDREGEAIAFHVATVLKLDVGNRKLDTEVGRLKLEKVNRIVFHEITKEAIEKALRHPRGIDMPLVDAQQARRVLDRIVGYKLSPLLWKKMGMNWLSAGRVQSIAVRLIVEREREIQKFSTTEYYKIFGKFEIRNSKSEKFDAELVAKNGEKYESVEKYDLFDGEYTVTKTTIQTEDAAQKIITALTPPFTVSACETKETRRQPPAPFTTSVLQQTAGNVLGFSAKRTMQTAQKLYEEGLITYHRTDSVTLSEKFLKSAQEFISSTYGLEFAVLTPRQYKNKAKLAQEAHEAIRPTDVGMTNDKFQMSNGELNRDHIRLYELIWKRAVASQATDAIMDATTIIVASSNGYTFQTNGSIVKFEGFLKITGRTSEDVLLPRLKVGDTANLLSAEKTAKITEPPARYSEAKLIKSLEEHGIGRPSTYAPTLATIEERQYVTRETATGVGRRFIPTDLGMSVNDFLVLHFGDIVNLPFTATIEGELDEIAQGTREWTSAMSDFYVPFEKTLTHTELNAPNTQAPVEETNEKCPTCGNPLVIRIGRFGKFYACSKFPECTFTRSFSWKLDIKCPRCDGQIVMKKTKKKKSFYGCSNYPTCDFASWTKPKPA